MARRIWAVVAMTAGADWLFYGHDMGVSLALYGLGVMGVVLALRGGRVTRAERLRLGYVPQRLAIDRTLPMTAARFLSLPQRVLPVQLLLQRVLLLPQREW